MKLLITGGSGYFGRLIIPTLLKSEQFELIVNLDPKPYFIENKKYFWLGKSLLSNFESNLMKFGPFEAVLHLAYKIRPPYGKNKLLKWAQENILAAEKIFRFALKTGVKKFLHASTVAVYGARKENSLQRKFTENSPLADWSYAYAQNKKEIELKLQKLWQSKPELNLIILRIASVIGPQTQAYKKLGLVHLLKSKLPFIFYVRKDSGRQYLSEKDLQRVIYFLLTKEFTEKLLIFNLASKDFLTFQEIAKLEKKIALPIPYFLAKLVFALSWHFSFGKLPTGPSAIDAYAFPIYVDVSKIEQYGFHFLYSSKEAYTLK